MPARILDPEREQPAVFAPAIAVTGPPPASWP